ncbi:MAG: hypothetical protein N3D12_02405 [Candidatus Methanomethyliaceae archaeon]|nr:hypothetical protein [Candidatus Methanomethyliaceae archaeon]
MVIKDEDDNMLFEISDFRAAIGNVVQELKKMADIICKEDNGKGVSGAE